MLLQRIVLNLRIKLRINLRIKLRINLRIKLNLRLMCLLRRVEEQELLVAGVPSFLNNDDIFNE
jgi:hypothetical protein